MNCISSQPAFHPCIPEAPRVAPPAVAPWTSSSPVGLLHLPAFDSVKSLVSLSRVTHCNPQNVFGVICSHSKPEFQLLSHSGQVLMGVSPRVFLNWLFHPALRILNSGGFAFHSSGLFSSEYYLIIHFQALELSRLGDSMACLCDCQQL